MQKETLKYRGSIDAAPKWPYGHFANGLSVPRKGRVRMAKFQCNACADTEGGFLPCTFDCPLAANEKTIGDKLACPISKEDCEWEIVKEARAPIAELPLSARSQRIAKSIRPL